MKKNTSSDTNTSAAIAHREDIATKPQLAAILQISEQTINKHPERFPRFKVGPLARYHVPEVIEHLKVASRRQEGVA